MTYAEAMVRFGTDRPDMRFGLEIARRLRRAARRGVQGLRGACSAAAASCARINAGAREMSRSELDGLNEVVQRHGAKAVALGVRRGRRRVALADRQVLQRRADRRGRRASSGATDGDLLLFVADRARRRAGRARRAARSSSAERFGLIPDGPPRRSLWIVDFPMFECNEDEQRWDRAAPPVHRAGRRRSTTRARCCSRGYDLVARRLGDRRRLDPYPHAPRSSSRSSRRSACARRRPQARFGFLLDALRYGAPPHGGIAFGHRPHRGDRSPAASRSATSSRSPRPPAAPTR